MTRPKQGVPQITKSPFKQMRLDAQLSQEALAQKIGVAVSTIRRWEKGLAEPTMTVVQLKGFLNAVNVNFQELPDSLLPVN
ncbi:MAG: helix-turn-helix transcriptional regulator [Okeania sp. SIO2B9]|nr:helix-turn-helix transcriptional regulator [Okeania sp. SIO2B9]